MDVDPNYDPSDFLLHGSFAQSRVLDSSAVFDGAVDNLAMHYQAMTPGPAHLPDDLAVSESDEENDQKSNIANMTAIIEEKPSLLLDSIKDPPDGDDDALWF